MFFIKLPIFLIALSFVLALSGCTDKIRTVSYYVDNADEARKVLEECREESKKGYAVEGILKENCRNARRAQRQLIRDNILN